MSVFKRRHFPVEIILVCVRWSCEYGISDRDPAKMMQERGVEVDHTTILRSGRRSFAGDRGAEPSFVAVLQGDGKAVACRYGLADGQPQSAPLDLGLRGAQ